MSKPVIVINEIDRIVTTIFHDGSQLHAAPRPDDPESVARATALGYDSKGGVWAMTKDHERLHHLVADARGHDFSTALWLAAHPDALAFVSEDTAKDMRAQADDEERIVLLIQRLLNQGIE